MQIESRLKFVFCLSYIRFLVVQSCFCYCCFINNAFSEALAVKWARAFLPTVTYFDILNTYIGLTENEFKTRLNLHKSFSN